MKRLIVVLIGFVVFGCMQDVGTQSDIEAVKKVHQKYVEAERNMDVEAALSLWTDDGVAMRGNQLPMIGKQSIRADWESFNKVTVEGLKIQVDEMEVSGDLAYIRQVYKAKWIPKDGSEPEYENSKEIMILKKQNDNSWKIARYIWNPSPYVGEIAGQELWDKVVSYHDPDGSWDSFEGKVHLISTHANRYSDEQIEISKPDNLYRGYWSDGTNQLVRTVQNDKCFYSINGKTELNEDEMQEFGLSDEGNRQFKEHHTCHIGLPMELKSAGVKVEEEVTMVNFHGRQRYELMFNGDPESVKHPYYSGKWILYINPNTYAMDGARFKNDQTNFAGYFLTTSEIEVNGIKMPQIKTIYTDTGDFICTDNFTTVKDKELTAK